MEFARILCLAAAIGSCGLACATPDTGTGKTKIALSVFNESGKPLPLPAPGAAATVLIFVTPECPMANRYAPDLRALVDAYPAVRFYRVYASPDTTAADAGKHEEAYPFHCAALLDTDQSIASATGATRTPEIAVLDAQGVLRYLGAVDDRYTDLGKYKQTASKHYLHDALDAVLAGKPVPIERSEAVGCFIPLKDAKH